MPETKIPPVGAQEEAEASGVNSEDVVAELLPLKGNLKEVLADSPTDEQLKQIEAQLAHLTQIAEQQGKDLSQVIDEALANVAHRIK